MKALRVPCALSVGKIAIKPSIGIAICPKDGSSAGALRKSADAGMYQTKRKKSGYCFAP